MRRKGVTDKMKHWRQHALMDAALGGLPAAGEAELFEHVAECTACRGGFEQAKAACAAVDSGVEALVSGKPSGQFEARLCARIAAEPGPSRDRFGWMFWAPVAVGAVTVAAVLLFALREHAPRDAGPNAVPAAVAFVGPGPAPQLALSSQSQSIPATTSRYVHASRAVASTPAQSPEPEVLVEPGQFAAIVRYSDALASGTIKGDQVIAAQQALEKPLHIEFLEIKPTDIAPLRSSDANTATPASEDSSRP